MFDSIPATPVVVRASDPPLDDAQRSIAPYTPSRRGLVDDGCRRRDGARSAYRTLDGVLERVRCAGTVSLTTAASRLVAVTSA
jgi:hypothetical protein